MSDRRVAPAAIWLAWLLAAAAPAELQRSAAPPVRGEALWERLDHDAFLRGLGEQGLTAVLAALDRAEPTTDPVETLQRQIALVRAALTSPQRTPASVAAAAVEAMALRDALLAAVPPDDPQRLRWRCDELEDLHRWLLPAEGADLAVRIGVASPAQRAFVEAWVARAERSSAEMVALLRLIEAGPQRHEAVERILEEARGRVPLLRGLSLSRAAESVPDRADRIDLQREAATLLEAAALVDQPDLAELARIHLGLARLGLGEHEAARRAFEALAADAAASPRSRFEAETGLVLLRAAREDPDNARRLLNALRRGRGEDPAAAAFLPLWADLEHRLIVAEAGPGALLRPTAIAAALQPWIDLVEASAAPERAWLVPEALERLRRFGGEALRAGASAPSGDLTAAIPIDLEALPPIVAVALATAAIEVSQDDAGADEALGRAWSWLEGAVARSPRGAVTRRLALRTQARAAIGSERYAEAVEALLESVRDDPADPAAAASLDAAVAIATELAGARGGAGPWGALEQGTLDEATRLLPSHPRRDPWRIRLAEIDRDRGRFEEAARRLDAVLPSSGWIADARVLALENATTAAESRSGGEVARWIDRAERHLRQLEPWPATPPEGTDSARHRAAAARIGLARARLHLLAGRPAAALVEVATLRESVALEDPEQVEAVRVRLAAFDQLGRREDAAAELEQLTRLGREGGAAAGALLSARLEEAIAAAQEAARRGEVERQRRLAASASGPLADAVRTWWSGREHAMPAADRLLIAEGWLQAGRSAETLALLAELPPAAANTREVVRLRAEALFQRGRLEDLGEAMPLYRRLAAASAAGSETWWLSELRTLQILDRVGRDTERIRPRIARLRTQDPALGGEGFRRGFEALLLRP